MPLGLPHLDAMDPRVFRLLAFGEVVQGRDNGVFEGFAFAADAADGCHNHLLAAWNFLLCVGG